MLSPPRPRADARSSQALPAGLHPHVSSLASLQEPSDGGSPVLTGGLRRTPLSGGVQVCLFHMHHIFITPKKRNILVTVFRVCSTRTHTSVFFVYCTALYDGAGARSPSIAPWRQRATRLPSGRFQLSSTSAPVHYFVPRFSGFSQNRSYSCKRQN